MRAPSLLAQLKINKYSCLIGKPCILSMILCVAFLAHKLRTRVLSVRILQLTSNNLALY